MQGSYILLAALGIFILIGGAKRIVKSLKLSSISAVILIILIIVGNMFGVIGGAVYIGSILLIALCFIYIFTNHTKVILGTFASIIIVAGILLLYQFQIIDRFSIGELPSEIMLIAGCAISSFIFAKSAGQAFVIAILSMNLYYISALFMNGGIIVIGDNVAFDLMMYSSLGAIFLSEIVSEFVSLFSDRAPDLQFEAGKIEDEDKEIK